MDRHDTSIFGRLQIFNNERDVEDSTCRVRRMGHYRVIDQGH